MRLVAIHQPNFFPWLGYFNKIARADVFVVLDNVQFPKTGGTWSNRVKLLVNGEPAWVTAPVDRNYHGVREIREMQFDNATPWRRKLLQNLRTNYARADAFSGMFPVIERLVEYQAPSLAAYNLDAIRAICGLVALPVSKLVLASELGAAGQATDLLIALVKAVGGDAYLAGGGAAGYQEDEKFGAAGVQLVYQNFVHPAYPQSGRTEFAPGLSILDALMNCGAAGAAALVTAG